MVSLLARLGLAIPTAIGNLLTLGIEKAAGRKFGRQTTKELAQTRFGKVLGLSITGTAAVLGVLLSPAAAARQAASLIPKSGFGKTALLAVGGAAVASPVIRKAIIQTPSIIFEKGEALGLEAERQAEAAGERKPKTTLAILAGAALGLAAPSILGKVRERFAGQEVPTLDFEPLPSVLPLPKEKEAAAEKPVTAETETIEAGVKKKPSKRRSQPRRQTISQRVNVRVGVNAGNTRIIKNIIFV